MEAETAPPAAAPATTEPAADAKPPSGDDDAAATTTPSEYHPVVIVGGGIGGLVLALCLDRAYNPPSNTDPDAPSTPPSKLLPIHVYESTSAYKSDAGGAIGLYANGLRVLRDLSAPSGATPELLARVREAGCDYVYRRWMRHDGTEVAVAREDELLPDLDHGDGVGVGVGVGVGGGAAPPGLEDPEGERADRRPRGGSVRGVLTLPKRLSKLFVAKNHSGSNSESVTSSSTLSSPDSTPREETDAAAETSEDIQTTETTAALEEQPKPTIETELLSLGIRRWKYQQVLYEACLEAGIHIHFGKRLHRATTVVKPGSKDPLTCLHFKDGTTVETSLLIGADGINSKVRSYVTNPTPEEDQGEEKEFVPEYTGVTCLMGSANVPRIRGICFPSSATTKCHACYYPTRVPPPGADATENPNEDREDYEQVFQIYFPSPIERPDTWRTLTPEEAKEECRDLAKRLREDGWHEQFLAPLESETLTGVLRVGLRSREALDCWHVGGNAPSNDGDDDDVGEGAKAAVGRAVLLGDAAHPPVPYIGQGAQMAMEDAGTLSLLLKHFCPLVPTDNQSDESPIQIPDFSNFEKAMEVYESLRVTRTKTILGSSVQLGKTQQRRADSKLYNAWRELSIKAQVWAYGTLPVMRPGAAFDYKAKVEEVLAG